MVDKDQFGRPLTRPFAPNKDTDFNPIPRTQDLVKVRIEKEGDIPEVEITDTGRPVVKNKEEEPIVENKEED